MLEAFIIALLSISCLTVQASENIKKSILVVGDSLSAEYGIQRGTGWVSLLETSINKSHTGQYKLINASISGETSSGGAQRIKSLIETHKPILTIVELGANDALRGLSIEMTKSNLIAIVKTAQITGKVLLLEINIPPNYGKKYTEEFKGLYKGISKSTGATLVPFFLAELALKPDYFQTDKIHPNELAQPLIMNNVLPFVKRSLKP